MCTQHSTPECMQKLLFGFSPLHCRERAVENVLINAVFGWREYKGAGAFIRLCFLLKR